MPGERVGLAAGRGQQHGRRAPRPQRPAAHPPRRGAMPRGRCSAADARGLALRGGALRVRLTDCLPSGVTPGSTGRSWLVLQPVVANSIAQLPARLAGTPAGIGAPARRCLPCGRAGYRYSVRAAAASAANLPVLPSVTGRLRRHCACTPPDPAGPSGLLEATA